MKLAELTPDFIMQWQMDLTAKGVGGVPCNHALGVLKRMLAWAQLKRLIATNPATDIEKVGANHKVRGILLMDEVERIFNPFNLNKVWGGDLNHYTMNLLAATTGMRLAEIQGLQLQYVNLVTGHISIEQSWHNKYGLGDPKCGSYRKNMPLTSVVAKLLGTVIVKNGCRDPEDLVFPGDARRILCRDPKANPKRKPINHKWMDKKLCRALKEIGVDAEARGIVFHSWRHFFTTYLEKSEVPDAIVRKWTAHRSRAKEGYVHVSGDDIGPVMPLLEETFKIAEGAIHF